MYKITRNALIAVSFITGLAVAGHLWGAARPVHLYYAVIENCHIPIDAAATCSFKSAPPNREIRAVNEQDIALNLTGARKVGITGAALESIAPSEGKCLITRNRIYCITPDMADADIASIARQAIEHTTEHLGQK